MPRKVKQSRTKERKSASLKWHLAHDRLLPIVDANIKIVKSRLACKGLSGDERCDLQFELEAWNELKKEMS